MMDIDNDTSFVDLPTPPKTSPNPKIDAAINKLLKKVDNEPSDVACKILTIAINWEKAKRGILEKETAFDPDQI